MVAWPSAIELGLATHPSWNSGHPQVSPWCKHSCPTTLSDHLLAPYQNRLANADPTEGHQVPRCEPRDPAHFQHLSNGERKVTFRIRRSRAHSVRHRHGLSDPHDFRIFSSMAFLDDPNRRTTEFFPRGMMGRKQSAAMKGRNGSLDSAPLPAPYPREFIKVKRQRRLKASNEGYNNLSINTDVNFMTIAVIHRTLGQIWQGPGLRQPWQRYLKTN